jgi:ATP/maltotriose-dependent transcriptional regulator MalT
MLAGGSETLGYAAEALLLAGDLDAAQRQVEEALQIADNRRERVYLPQLLLLQAKIVRARGQPTAALASVRSAIEEARAQEAPWLELLALVELCEHEGAKAKDRQALAALVDRLHEAAETDAVARARALIRRARAAVT